MKEELLSHRRVLVQAYQRYLDAEDRLYAAQQAALTFFPADSRPQVPPIGQPGSRIRRLHDRRARALARLALLRKMMQDSRSRAQPTTRIFLLPRH